MTAVNKTATVLLLVAATVCLCRDAAARAPIYLKDAAGNSIAADSNTPYSPKMTCSGPVADAVQFFGSPPVIGSAGCHASIINGYGLSRDTGTCRVFDPLLPAWTQVAAATQEACDIAGGMWFPDLSALYESDGGSAVKDHGAGTTPYAVPYALHGISAGYHFQQGRNTGWGNTQRAHYGLPGFTSSPGMFGNFSPAFNRSLADLDEAVPARFDMSAYDFATSGCAWCHPGGGNMEYDREGYRYDGEPGFSAAGANPDPKTGDYYTYDPGTGAIVSRLPEWQDGGSGEVDCLICHTETAYGYSHLERNHALSEAKAPGFAASLSLANPDGATGFLRIPRMGGDGINPDISTMAWNEQSWWFSWLTWDYISGVYLEDTHVVPPKEACAQCHFADKSLADNGPASRPLGESVFQKILPAGTVTDGDVLAPGGTNSAAWTIFNGRSGTDKAAVSINDANNPDAHMDGGTACSTCHYLLGAARNYQDACLVCHSDFYGAPWSDPVTPPAPQVFPAVRDAGGTVVQPAVEVFKIDHQFAKGNSKPEGANMDQFDNTVTCESCHTAGTHPKKNAAPNPAGAHAALPPIHFSRIDCRTCHIPLLNGPMKQNVLDFTAGPYQESQRGQASASSSGVAFRPLYIWRTKTHDGSGMHIVPVSVLTAALWADGTSWAPDGSASAFTPVFQRTAQGAAEALRLAYGDGDADGIFDWPLNRPQGGDASLIVNRQPEVGDMVTQLRAMGVPEPVMALSFQSYSISHNVAPKSSNLILGSPGGGGCVMCHASSNPASLQYSPKAVGFFDKTYVLFDQPADGGSGLVQTAVNLFGTSDPAKRVNATFRGKWENGSAFAIDLAGASGSTVRNTINQDEVLGLLDYANPLVAGIPTPLAMFSYTVSGLLVSFNAAASTCPSGSCSYSWNFGDSSTGSGVVTSRTYATAGTYAVKLTVLDNVNFTQHIKTVSLSVVAGDQPPTVGGTCTFDANTWTSTVIDASTDDNGIGQVTVNWGDGTMLSSDTTAPFGPFVHTFLKPGTFTITRKVIDTIGQQAVDSSCTASPAYFAIAGAVFASDTITPVPSAIVRVKLGATTIRTVYTAGNGTFAVGSLKPGTYTLTVTKAGYTFAVPAATLTVGPNQFGTIFATAP